MKHATPIAARRRNVGAAIACTLALLLAPVAAGADVACRVQSGATTRPLVELYTSEGCSSCPPADRWLSHTFADRAAPAVAIALHVDYWDRLGWKDRFAHHAFTERQQRAADANHADFVYTPQVLLQGRDLRWRDARAADALAAAAAKPSRAALALTARRKDGRVEAQATATVPDSGARADAVIVLAYVDSGLSSDVEAGENRGVRLNHDHVVRKLVAGGQPDAKGRIEANATFTLPAEAGRDATLVAFVQRTRAGDVLQALDLPLAGCAP
jgi:hypothetical protein